MGSIYASLNGVRPVCILPRGNSVGWVAQYETDRNNVNDFVKSQPNFIDADAVLGDGGNPVKLQAQYDSGDGIHLSTAGKAALATAILNQGNW
jgi:lysophospholipase L1-like esterase